MGWNYRVMRHSSKKENTADLEEWLGIHEVYYRNDEVDDLSVSAHEIGYTEMPIKMVAEDIEELRWMLDEMLKALAKPILEYADDQTRIQSDSRSK
jgi:hypothetical protein